MEKEPTIQFPEEYQKLSSTNINGFGTKKIKLPWCLSLLVLTVLVLFSMYTNWCLKGEVDQLHKKIVLLEVKAEVDIQLMQNLQKLIDLEIKNRESQTILDDIRNPESVEDQSSNIEEFDSDDNETDFYNFGFKRKREIREYNDSSIESDFKATNKSENKNKQNIEKSSGEGASTELSSMESSSKEKIYRTRKSHLHRKHKKSKIGSAERFFTETHSTTSTPIQVRQSRTKPTQMQKIDKTLWLQNQKFQQHTSPHKDEITKEEAIRKGYGRSLEEGYELESTRENKPDALSYNMITIHFSADTSHYNREKDPHYFGNGRMQIKSEVYKDWKPAHWTQGVGMTKYFHLHQGRVTVSTTGIYLIYAQIQYSNVQEVNGFSVFRNKEVVVQCITTSTHPDKLEIKSNTCGISTTILLQSNDSVCIKDLHHGRYVVLTPEKSYFGLVLLSPFKQ